MALAPQPQDEPSGPPVRRPPSGSGAGAPATRVPPHNLPAEESLLGAMLLSRDAISAAAEYIDATHFYKPAHGHIYEAITAIIGRGDPVDPVTVADELGRRELLDAVGGTPALLTLQAGTPATSNAARYARIIEEHALLRRLIGVAGEIAELGYGLPDDVEAAIDRAEAMVFQVAEHRVTDSTSHLYGLLDEALGRLEMLYEKGDAITGVPTGYLDLDELLSGLQNSALNVVGARPAMGKTSFALGAALHAAMKAQRPVLFFSLEMSRVELSQRLLCAEARVDSTRVRNGRLSDEDWRRIISATGPLSEARLWIDDNPNVTVMEMRAKARRLKSKERDLGLVVVDYVQLMTGRTSAESRQVEVSEISRGLKILARELDCPVMALAQLNRGLEQRADKRPMLSDLRESGCLTASTRVLRADTGTESTLGDLLAEGARDIPVWSVDTAGKLVPSVMTHVFPSGTKPVFQLRLGSGRTVDASANHPFLTIDGWRRLDELGPGARLAVPRVVPPPAQLTSLPTDEVVLLAHLLGDGCVLPHQPIHYTSADAANLEAVETAAASRFGITARRVRQQNWWHTYLPAPFRLTHGRRNPISQWWSELGLHDCRSHQKFVPQVIRALPSPQVAVFLHHLWATDGSISIRRQGSRRQVSLYYSTSSRRLADDVQSLLLRLSIRSRVMAVTKANYRPGYQVVIQGGPDQRRYLEAVGIHGARGSRGSDALSVLQGRAENPNVDTVPWGVRAKIVSRMAEVGVSQRALASELGEPYCGSYLLGTAARPRSSSRARLSRIADVLDSKELRRIAESDLFWDRVVAIEAVGEEPVFDATVVGTHNFLANGVVVHNSLEQDADVVMFIYRDEMYNPETTDMGTAEIIVAKHRSGPTDKVRLAFLGHQTRFENMAKGM